jgi:hypothetical protein
VFHARTGRTLERSNSLPETSHVPDDIQSQILAAVGPFVGTTADATDTRNDIYHAILAVPGVASVGVHSDTETGAVDAAVELTDGEVLTVEITAGATVDVDPASAGHTGVCYRHQC